MVRAIDLILGSTIDDSSGRGHPKSTTPAFFCALVHPYSVQYYCDRLATRLSSAGSTNPT
jgi:hypothetical protein